MVQASPNPKWTNGPKFLEWDYQKYNNIIFEYIKKNTEQGQRGEKCPSILFDSIVAGTACETPGHNNKVINPPTAWMLVTESVTYIRGSTKIQHRSRNQL